MTDELPKDAKGVGAGDFQGKAALNKETHSPMYWRCGHCGGGAPLIASNCEKCGADKNSWKGPSE